MHSAYVSRLLPEGGMRLLDGKVDYQVNPHDRVATKEEIIDGLKGKDALLCLLTDAIDADIMDAAPLKVISNYAVGYNNIDIAAATKRGIPVTNTPGVLSKTTADLAFTLILACARRVPEGDSFMRQGKFSGWGPMTHLGWDVNGKTLGVIGAGSIGCEVLQRGKGFGMRLLYHNRNPSEEADQLGAKLASMEELLAKSDFVSINVPLNEKTTNLMNENTIGMMKPSATLVNTSRGEVIDEEALMKALRDGTIRAAGMDVFRGEPLNIDARLYDTPNIVFTPHVGSGTTETRTAMAVLAAENMLDVLEGRRPKHLVNPEVWE